MNLDGSDVIAIDNVGNLRKTVDGGGVFWSPDGTRLAYVLARGQIHVANFDGTGKVRVDDHWAAAFLGWSPDGERIAYHGPPAGTRAYSVTSKGDISVVNADGTGHLILAQSCTIRLDVGPWSPDGRYLAFRN